MYAFDLLNYLKADCPFLTPLDINRQQSPIYFKLLALCPDGLKAPELLTIFAIDV